MIARTTGRQIVLMELIDDKGKPAWQWLTQGFGENTGCDTAFAPELACVLSGAANAVLSSYCSRKAGLVDKKERYGPEPDGERFKLLDYDRGASLPSAPLAALPEFDFKETDAA